MAMTLSELAAEFEKSKLKFRVSDRGDFISTGMATQRYLDKDGDQGVMIQVRLQEKVNRASDSKPLSSEALQKFQSALEQASNTELSMDKLRELMSRTLGEDDGEASFELISFIAPLYFHPERKPPREELLSIANRVNAKIKFSSFTIDSDNDVIFLYQISLDDPEQKFLSGCLRRVFGAMAQACDEFHDHVDAYHHGSASGSESSVQSNTQPADAAESNDDPRSLIKRALTIYVSREEKKLEEEAFSRLVKIVQQMVEHKMITVEMADDDIYAKIVAVLKSLSEKSAEDDQTEH